MEPSGTTQPLFSRPEQSVIVQPPPGAGAGAFSLRGVFSGRDASSLSD
jgi:hypothetical protein